MIDDRILVLPNDAGVLTPKGRRAVTAKMNVDMVFVQNGGRRCVAVAAVFFDELFWTKNFDVESDFATILLNANRPQRFLVVYRCRQPDFDHYQSRPSTDVRCHRDESLSSLRY